MHGPALRGERLAERAHEGEEGGRVEGPFGAAAGVRRVWVRHGGELGAREVVAVHGDEGGDGDVGAARVVLGVEVIEALGDEAGERGFAWVRKGGVNEGWARRSRGSSLLGTRARYAGDSDQESLRCGRLLVFCFKMVIIRPCAGRAQG